MDRQSSFNGYISCFHHTVVNTFTLLGHHTVYVGSLPTFWGSLLNPPSRAKNNCLTLEDGTSRPSLNTGKELPAYLVKHPKRVKAAVLVDIL
jgi:hypothetical protein